MNNNSILITGAHRSGTTFVGRMLSMNRSVGYIQEPFNKAYGLKLFDTDFKYFTKHTIQPTEREVLEDLFKMKRADYHIPSIVKDHEKVENRAALVSELLNNPDSKILFKFCKRFLFKSGAQCSFYKAKYNPFIERLLFKDPIACMSSEFLHERYNLAVVVLVRHPLSFAGSIKRLQWTFDFDQFLRQQALMQNHLSKYTEALLRAQSEGATTIESASLLWNCIYDVLSTYIANNPSFLVYKHEDIAQHPLESFKKLYEDLGLQYSAKIEAKILEHTSRDNPVQPENNRTHQLNRDSANLIYKWKDILTDREIDYVLQNTATVAQNFYEENFYEQAH